MSKRCSFQHTRVENDEQKIGQFLRETLKLEMSEEKTLITQASRQPARFLGYEIVNQQNDSKHARKRRSANGKIGLRVPTDVVAKKSAQYLRHGKPIHRPERLQDTDYSMVMQYQQEYRGMVQYYLLAQNVSHLYRLHWAMKGSLLKTLANKHKTSSTAIARKYQTTVQAPNGTDLKCLQVVVEREGKKPLVAQFGGLQLIPQPKATILPRDAQRDAKQAIREETQRHCFEGGKGEWKGRNTGSVSVVTDARFWRACEAVLQNQPITTHGSLIF